MIIILTQYITAEKSAQAEITEKRSRFIAHVKPVSSEAEALDYLNAIKQKYWDARHNVYAYVLRDNNVMRYSDDGEPGGTAGVPVLEILKKESLTDIIVVVTRYFGGILLGTGGLVHAYSSAAKAGLAAAGIVKMVLCREIILTCDYSMIGKIQYETAEFPDVVCGEISYGESVEMHVYVPTENEEIYRKNIIDKTNANVSVKLGETNYIEMKA